MKRVITLLIASSMLTACISTQQLSEDNKRSIHTVAIDKNVEIPADMVYVGPGFGYVGPIISGIAGYSSAEKIKNQAQKNNINISQIVSSEVATQLHDIPRLKVEDKNKADAFLKVKVLTYGFSIQQGYAFEVVPLVSVDAELIKGNQIVWKNHSTPNLWFDGMKSYKVSELESNPNAIATAWRAASEKSIHDVLSTLY